MLYNHDLTLDISGALSPPLAEPVKQGDTARQLRIALTDRGEPYAPPDGAYALLRACKPDGRMVLNPCEIQDGRIVAPLTEQLVAVPGSVRCEICLYDQAAQLLTSAVFRVEVRPFAAGDRRVQSTDEYLSVVQALAKVEQSQEVAGTALDTARQAVDTASQAESIVQADVDAFRGVTLPSALEAVAQKGGEQVQFAADYAAAAAESANTAKAEADRVAAIDAYTKQQGDNRYGPAIIGTAQGAPVQITDAWTGAALHRLEAAGLSAEIPAAEGPDAAKGPETPVTITGSSPTSITVTAGGEEVITLPTALELHDLPGKDGTPWLWDGYDVVSGKLVRRVGCTTLTGNETWRIWAENKDTTSYYTSIVSLRIPSAAVDNKGLRSTHFPSAHTSGEYYSIQTGLEAIGLSPKGDLFAVCVPTAVAADLAGWKAWLAAHPVTVYYPLAEPEVSQLAGPREVVLQAPALQAAADDGAVAVEYTRDSTVYLSNELAQLRNAIIKMGGTL